MLKIGDVVAYDGRYWRVGLLNPSRARLDPLTGRATSIGGSSFTSYGDPVNVSAGAELDVVDLAELPTAARRRLDTLAGAELAPPLKAYQDRITARVAHEVRRFAADVARPLARRRRVK